MNERYGTPDKLLIWSKKTKNPLESKRFLAIRMLMTGSSREEVMKCFGLNWSTLQKWVKLWNKGGQEYLRVGIPSGRPQKLNQEAKDFLVRKIEFTHPKTGERITGVAISGILEKKFRDKIEQKCNLLLSSQAKFSQDPPKKNPDKEK